MNIPERIGRYRILGFLASGGMAEILLAKLLGPGGFERAVVLKRALPHLARQTEFRNMFIDEARIVARIRHPNVVHVSELGDDDDELFLVMEYLAGESVSSLVRRLNGRGRTLTAAIATYIIAEAAAGLHASHELRSEDGTPLEVVHRDVSPQNVFVCYSGEVKLLDFGIAKFGDRSVETHTGQVKGKFAYMSPEQCAGESLDRRSDVFSLAILLWELCTGHRLFARSNDLLVWKAIAEEDIPAPSTHMPPEAAPLPAILEHAILKALARDPEDRYSSAHEFRRDLLAALREIDPEQRELEALSALMQELFAKRIDEKQEMLQRVRAGTPLGPIPAADADDNDAPSVAIEYGAAGLEALHEDALDGTYYDEGVHRSRAEAAIASKRSPNHLYALLAVLIASLFGIAAAYALVSFESDVEVRAHNLVATEAAESATASHTTSSENGEAVSEPRVRADSISLYVESLPTGASVEIDGTEHGQTPLRAILPRSNTPIELILRAPGYRDHTATITPNIQQQLRISLQRRPRRPRRGPARRSTTSSPAPSSRSASQPAEQGYYRFQ